MVDMFVHHESWLVHRRCDVLNLEGWVSRYGDGFLKVWKNRC